MSKIKDGDMECAFWQKKDKLRHSLRREESHQIKKDRMKKAKDDIYRYGRGYWVKEEVKKTTKANVLVPEKVTRRYLFLGYRNYQYGEEGTLTASSCKVPIYKEITEVVPEHTTKRTVSIDYVPIKPRLRRCYIAKRWFKKQASKRVRKMDLKNGGSYKKAYDIAWALW